MKTLVVAPHPDDELLGVGGTLLKRKAQGFEVAWLIVTSASSTVNWSEENIVKRKKDLELIKEGLNFNEVYELDYPSAEIDSIPFSSIVNSISKTISTFCPEEIFLPHIGDVHSDHEIVHRAVISSTKAFRHPNIKRLLSYETLSETEYGLDKSRLFSPNLYVDISDYIDRKIDLMRIYTSELSEFPFPRSEEALLALARYRGSSCLCMAAEAFQLLKQIE